MIELNLPATDEDVLKLKVGDTVSVNGVMITARDRAHKYFIETLLGREVPPAELALYRELQQLLRGGAIYHCGPIVRKVGDRWEFVAAGPTTSNREEPYEATIIEHFGVKAIIGKGGMGAQTLEACRKFKAVYLHAIGGAGALTAENVKEVLGVEKLDFGVPEAIWKIRVENFPAVVTMDAHGNSLHQDIEAASKKVLDELLA